VVCNDELSAAKRKSHRVRGVRLQLQGMRPSCGGSIDDLKSPLQGLIVVARHLCHNERGMVDSEFSSPIAFSRSTCSAAQRSTSRPHPCNQRPGAKPSDSNTRLDARLLLFTRPRTMAVGQSRWRRRVPAGEESGQALCLGAAGNGVVEFPPSDGPARSGSGRRAGVRGSPRCTGAYWWVGEPLREPSVVRLGLNLRRMKAVGTRDGVVGPFEEEISV